jgi:hypothetical protein
VSSGARGSKATTTLRKLQLRVFLSLFWMFGETDVAARAR